MKQEMQAPLPSGGPKQGPHATHSPSPAPAAVPQQAWAPPTTAMEEMASIHQAWAPPTTMEEMALHFSALEQGYQWQLAMAHERIAYLEHLLLAHPLCAGCGSALL